MIAGFGHPGVALEADDAIVEVIDRIIAITGERRGSHSVILRASFNAIQVLQLLPPGAALSLRPDPAGGEGA